MYSCDENCRTIVKARHAPSLKFMQRIAKVAVRRSRCSCDQRCRAIWLARFRTAHRVLLRQPTIDRLTSAFEGCPAPAKKLFTGGCPCCSNFGLLIKAAVLPSNCSNVLFAHYGDRCRRGATSAVVQEQTFGMFSCAEARIRLPRHRGHLDRPISNA